MAMTGARIGDVFCRSWGYDQTNVDFYELVSLSTSGKTGKARRVSSVTVADDGPSTRVTAATGPDRFPTKVSCSRCSNYHAAEPGWDGHQFSDLYTYTAKTDQVTVTSYGDRAYRWNGQSMHETGFGFGH